MVLNAIAGRGMFILVAVVTIPVYAVFGMLGGLLGTALFKRKTPPTNAAGDQGATT
jgi:hypothetical protein